MRKRWGKKKAILGITALGVLILGMALAAKRTVENRNMDADKSNMEREKEERGEEGAHPVTAYEGSVKPAMDKLLSFAGLVVLSPLFAIISVAIVIDDPGPIFFTQKRVGKDRKFFSLHKFRTMKMETPHDVPTHRLEHPEQYITRVGKLLRRTSLDELPQLWDIFRGEMSIVGPRPALWNQDDLIAERDRYGANSIKPGLTGWAQVNGRDELEIPEKAKLDGEYITHLRQGGLRALFFDGKCIARTVANVLDGDGVVEGGTGSMDKDNSVSPADAGFEEYAYRKKFVIDAGPTNHKRVLITGAGSYIGESFAAYAENHYGDNFTIDTVDMLDGSWKERDFSSYDTVFHVAGIAHADVGDADEETKKKYYAVNTDLAIQTAKKAKAGGVRQFVFMSSMIIYGDSAPYGKEKVIDEHTLPSPSNFYGDSKWQADKGVRALGDENFHVAVLRPPMVYGKGSKGNYPLLAKLAKKLPVFPDVENQRSMLYIDNLCELLCKLMLSGEGGVYFPQNGEYTNTSKMVRQIAEAAGKRIWITKLLRPAVILGSHVPGRISGLVDKAFGNSVYCKKVSNYENIAYQNITLKESIVGTESGDASSVIKQSPLLSREIEQNKNAKRKVLILTSVASMIDQFNRSNISVLLDLGYSVDVACNYILGNTCSDEKILELKKELESKEVCCIQIDFTRSVMDLRQDAIAFKQVKKLCTENDYVFIHCQSPIGGVIGRIVAKRTGTKVIYTAHGFHFYNGASLKNWLLYYPIEKMLSYFTDILITINSEDYQRAKKKFHAKNTVYIPGVGIDVERFNNGLINAEKKRKELGVSCDEIILLSVGELIPRKNHEVIIRALSEINNPKIEYFIAGSGELEDRLKTLAKNLKIDRQVHFLGFRTDISELCQAADLFILPSHQEGLSLALMEAIASRVPVVCSKIRGNIDLIKDERFLFDQSNMKSIVNCLKSLITTREDIKCYTAGLVEDNFKNLGKYSLSKVEKIMKEQYGGKES